MLIIMILSSLTLQIKYTLLLFEMVQVFGFNTSEMQQLKRTAEQIFGCDFDVPLKKGIVLIWKISGNQEPFTPLQYNGEDVHFGPEETYLLITQKPRKGSTIYYWLGKNTSLSDKKAASTYAIFLSSIYKFQRVGIAREIEGMESDSFQHTMKMFNRHAGPRNEKDDYALYLDLHFPSAQPNLYVIWGDLHSQIKKVPLSLGLKWLKKKDICLVLEAAYTVEDMLPMNHYCGEETKNSIIRRSKSFAVSFFGYFTIPDVSYRHKIENNKHSNDFKQFLEILENNRFYNPNEMDDSGDHLKNTAKFAIDRAREILLFDITSAGLEENPTRTIKSNTFQWYNRMGYLLDTKSVAGVFLILSDSEKIMDGVKSIHLAEEYMDDKYALSSGKITRMRITEAKPTNRIMDFRINYDYHSPITNIIQDY